MLTCDEGGGTDSTNTRVKFRWSSLWSCTTGSGSPVRPFRPAWQPATWDVVPSAPWAAGESRLRSAGRL